MTASQVQSRVRDTAVKILDAPLDLPYALVRAPIAAKVGPYNDGDMKPEAPSGPAHTPMMHHGEGRARVPFPDHLRSTYTGTYTALLPKN